MFLMFLDLGELNFKYLLINKFYKAEKLDFYLSLQGTE